MNAKTLEAIKRHGETLLAAFPNATEKDPVALCKKLRRIETATHRVMLDYCNGDASMEQADIAEAKAQRRLHDLLNAGLRDAWPIHINRDPRGYALKLDDEWMRQNMWTLNRENRHTNGSGSIALARLHRDMGGYGILAPDLTQE